MTAAFFDAVRAMAGGALKQSQVDHFNRILAASAALPIQHRAYILATAWHETARFKHLREIWGPTDQQRRYEGRADLGNAVAGDGKRFLGRGYVQITGRRNYSDWSKRLGIDLVGKPTLAEQPEIAARMLVEGMRLGTFTGKKLDDYPGDFVGARRIVNGTDRAALIAGYAREFEAALAWAGAEPPVRPDAPDAFRDIATDRPGFWVNLIAAFFSFFGRRK